MKRLVFTVTNDLNYDQRMIRICSSLAAAGYAVLLVGRQYSDSPRLVPRSFQQKRLSCFFRKGVWFYAEYNLRLFFYLLFHSFDLVCAIDLDTILPAYYASKWKKKKRVYDAHELFCEMKEVVSRPSIYRIWKQVEGKTVPHFPRGYTVNEPIRNIFQQQYGVAYEVIRNLPLLHPAAPPQTSERFIIYQGAVNHGRSFETLIPAFQWIDCPLWIFGDGNFLEEAKALVHHYGLQQKVLFKGKALPEQLRQITRSALLGLTLFENNGLSNYYSLANRFFDYIHAGIPQLCVDYPVYRSINDQYNIAVMIEDLSPAAIAEKINMLLQNKELQQTLRLNCQKARLALNWQQEEKKLLHFYQKLFASE